MALATETRSDTEFQRDVLAELKWEPRVQPNEIVKDGEEDRGGAETDGRERRIADQCRSKGQQGHLEGDSAANPIPNAIMTRTYPSRE
jgi:hypothetical protein